MNFFFAAFLSTIIFKQQALLGNLMHPQYLYKGVFPLALWTNGWTNGQMDGYALL